MNISELSKKYTVRRLGEEDVPQIVALCSGNPLYYKHCPPFVTEESVREDMCALPPKKTPDDKYFVGYFSGGRLIALLDLITEYPDDETAFIGLFMTDSSAQHKGVGSAIISELCVCMGKNGFKHVRLGWVKGNPQSEGFWHKNGFAETGVVSEQELYTVIVAQREL